MSHVLVLHWLYLLYRVLKIMPFHCRTENDLVIRRNKLVTFSRWHCGPCFCYNSMSDFAMLWQVQPVPQMYLYEYKRKHFSKNETKVSCSSFLIQLYHRNTVIEVSSQQTFIECLICAQYYRKGRIQDPFYRSA